MKMLSNKELESGSVGKVFIKQVWAPDFGSQSPHKMWHSYRGPPVIPDAERQTMGQADRLAELGSARDQGSLYKVENNWARCLVSASCLTCTHTHIQCAPRHNQICICTCMHKVHTCIGKMFSTKNIKQQYHINKVWVFVTWSMV